LPSAIQKQEPKQNKDKFIGIHYAKAQRRRDAKDFIPVYRAKAQRRKGAKIFKGFSSSLSSPFAFLRAFASLREVFSKKFFILCVP
jgi:hypothetical protein